MNLKSPWVLLVALGAASASSCSSVNPQPDVGPSTFAVSVDTVNGMPLPGMDSPLPANHGDVDEQWAFTITAHDPVGKQTNFTGMVRLSVRPGAVDSLTGEGVSGRNIMVVNGVAKGVANVTAVYGPARLWVEDLGYKPAAPNTVPACSNGKDDNGNGLIDYPADPGCAFADDDSEDGGTYAAGVSPAVNYSLPKVSDVRGNGAETPYPNEAVEIATDPPQTLIVTRVSSDGFYVTDISPGEIANGNNSLFAFNFSTPANMRVCDRVTYLSGTSNDFFGFTELNFPSYKNSYVVLGADGGVIQSGDDAGTADCQVPEPFLIDNTVLVADKNATAKSLRKVESALVRIENYTIAKNFGPTKAVGNKFGPGQSSCDFNDDGQVDFTLIADANNCAPGMCEGDCATLCDADPNCSEWTEFSARSEVKVSLGSATTMIKINTTTVAGFDPVANAGKTLTAVTGTLREFSGGTLNWTIETRCDDDLVCPAEMGCPTQNKISSKIACVRLRTIDDNDEGSN